jgi:hypothetical protein
MAKHPIAGQALERPVDDAASTTQQMEDRESGLFFSL